MACKFVQATTVMTDVCTKPMSDDEYVDSLVSESPEAKKRRYQRDPMSECTDPDCWITQKHRGGDSDEWCVRKPTPNLYCQKDTSHGSRGPSLFPFWLAELRSSAASSSTNGRQSRREGIFYKCSRDKVGPYQL